MQGRLHEGMTRTQSPARGGPKGRRAATLALLAALLLLALCWTTFSMAGGSAGHQAQAQTPDAGGGNSPEMAQAETAPEEPVEPGADGAEEYAAFGGKENPFDPVVSLAGQQEDDSEGGGNTDSEDIDTRDDQSTGTPDDDGGTNRAAAQNDGDGDDGGATPQGDEPPQDGSPNPSAPSPQSDSTGNIAPTQPAPGAIGPEDADEANADCANPADDFEELLCEEDAGATPSRDDSTMPGGQQGAPGSSGQQGGPGSGGSGRSGTGEPTETFRNGGGGASK